MFLCGPRRAPGDRNAHESVRGVVCERLEERKLLSAAVPRPGGHRAPPVRLHPVYQLEYRPGTMRAALSAAPAGRSPAQIRHFYGIDAIGLGALKGDGAGQTIAIVDAYDDPSALHDLQQFDKAFNLPDPVFQKLNENGGTNLPGTDPSGRGNQSWEIEESLDIEWAHAIAPAAKIVLYEANAADDGDLFVAARTAAQAPGVVAVSMSFGGPESFGDRSYNLYFTTPSGHPGVTFLAATGDTGSPGTYPAFSPNVVAVGGTSITLGAGSSYGRETGWSSSGGGFSDPGSGNQQEPDYQQSVQSSGMRSTPDVSMDADPRTGVAVYDSYDFGTSSPWSVIGGTSLATPMWAGLIAIADQARAQAGLPSLDGASQVLPRLYSLPAGDFHDVTSGSNGSFSAGVGYDEVTGLGTPVANLLVPALAGVTVPPANDSFNNAIALTGASATGSGASLAGTRETGEPLNVSNSAGQSVWWSWTAPQHAGQVTISTAGSDFDTTLGIYTGPSVDSLTQVASNDNDPNGGTSSLVTFTATPGTTYYISVDGNANAATTTGNVQLSLNAAPDNDNFTNAATLSGASASDSGFNDNATSELGEPAIQAVSGDQSVWWSWTAPDGAGSTTVTTAGSKFDNALGVFVGSSVDGLIPVGVAVSDSANAASLTFQASPGLTYLILVNGVVDVTGATAHGAVQLQVTSQIFLPAAVVGRYVFYDNSAFDGNDLSANASDDGAIAPDKSALLPGNTASFANYTSFSKGINGVMVDVANLPGTPNPTDFVTRVGNDSNPENWAIGPAPSSVLVRPGAGVSGSTRIELLFSDNAIQNEWLQVTMLPDLATGLSVPDVFYFGNAIGESGNSPGDAIVDSGDELSARNDPHSFFNPADIMNPNDFNRDGKVDATDQLIARNDQTTAGTALYLIIVAPAPPSVAARVLTGAGAGGHGSIDFHDLVILASHYGMQRGATFAMGDLNGDGKVDFADLVALASAYGKAAAHAPLVGF